MSSATAAVPKIIQRFRAHELRRALSVGGTQATGSTELSNPFIPARNPATGKWRPPLYSLRRQAELLKAAKRSGLVHLLPSGPKFGVQQLKEAKGKAVERAPLSADGQSSLNETTNERTEQISTGDNAISPNTKLENTALSKELAHAPENSSQAAEEASASQVELPKFSQLKRSAEARESGYADIEFNWVGVPKERKVAGAEFGARLYAGKKRMFKGHKWERTMKKRQNQIHARMRDMKKRIARFRNVRLLSFAVSYRPSIAIYLTADLFFYRSITGNDPDQ